MSSELELLLHDFSNKIKDFTVFEKFIQKVKDMSKDLSPEHQVYECEVMNIPIKFSTDYKNVNINNNSLYIDISSDIKYIKFKLDDFNSIGIFTSIHFTTFFLKDTDKFIFKMQYIEKNTTNSIPISDLIKLKLPTLFKNTIIFLGDICWLIDILKEKFESSLHTVQANDGNITKCAVKSAFKSTESAFKSTAESAD
jgi:hypothetical protein